MANADQTSGPGANRCDLVVIAVGFKPTLNLLAMGRRRPTWDSERGVLRVLDPGPGLYAAGELVGGIFYHRTMMTG